VYTSSASSLLCKSEKKSGLVINCSAMELRILLAVLVLLLPLEPGVRGDIDVVVPLLGIDEVCSLGDGALANNGRDESAVQGLG